MALDDVVFALLALAVGCTSGGADRDGYTVEEGDCDDRNPDRHPEAVEIALDGVDSDCDGSDLETRSLEEDARAIVTSRIPGHMFGYSVTCGPDLDGDGVGDFAMHADASYTPPGFEYSSRPREDGGPYFVPGPLDGRLEESDLPGFHVRPGGGLPASIGQTVAMVPAPLTPGLLFSAANQRSKSGNGGPMMATFVTVNDPIDVVTDAKDVFIGEGRGAPFVAGDLTGNGRPDIVVGDAGPFAVATATVWDAPPEGQEWVEDAPRSMSLPGFAVGYSLASGDWNGDGADDLALAQPLGVHDYGVVVVFGPLPLGDTPLDSNEATFRLTSAIHFGNEFTPIVAMGDLNGDAVDDLVVAQSRTRDDNGGVWVFYGPLSPGTFRLEADADATFEAETRDGWLGTAIATADLDGDGVDSLVVGASMNANYADFPRAGLVYVLDSPLGTGTLGADDVAMVFRGPKRRDAAGWSLAACDTDFDGIDELLVGAPSHSPDEDTEFAGRVYWLGEIAQ